MNGTTSVNPVGSLLTGVIMALEMTYGWREVKWETTSTGIRIAIY